MVLHAVVKEGILHGDDGTCPDSGSLIRVGGCCALRNSSSPVGGDSSAIARARDVVLTHPPHADCPEILRDRSAELHSQHLGPVRLHQVVGVPAFIKMFDLATAGRSKA